MCLNIWRVKKAIKPNVAKQDIVCYKVFINSYGILRTPFQNAYVSDEMVLKGLKPMCAIGPETVQFSHQSNLDNKYLFNVFEGFIHTYKSLKSAKEMARQLLFSICISYSIYKCIIPGGTIYYSGKDDYGRPSYASKEIILNEEI